MRVKRGDVEWSFNKYYEWVGYGSPPPCTQESLTISISTLESVLLQLLEVVTWAAPPHPRRDPRDGGVSPYATWSLGLTLAFFGVLMFVDLLLVQFHYCFTSNI